MTIDVWPIELPQRPLVEGYGEDMPDLDIASQMDIGPAKVRRETTAAPYLLTVPMRFLDWQKEFLKAWYRPRGRTTLFWFPEPGVDGYPLLDHDGVTVLLDENDVPLLGTSKLLVRMAQPPQWARQAWPKLGWISALHLEVLP
jgi:hypothetical protein